MAAKPDKTLKLILNSGHGKSRYKSPKQRLYSAASGFPYDKLISICCFVFSLDNRHTVSTWAVRGNMSTAAARTSP